MGPSFITSTRAALLNIALAMQQQGLDAKQSAPKYGCLEHVSSVQPTWMYSELLKDTQGEDWVRIGALLIGIVDWW